MRSLVIDDDYTSQTMFVRFLENFGTCDTATTGLDGLQKFKDSINQGAKYDLVVIDIILPDINGDIVLESIRSEERFLSTKIVLTTSLDDKENRQLCGKLRSGHETYYVKRCALDGFREKLGELGLD